MHQSIDQSFIFSQDIDEMTTIFSSNKNQSLQILSYDEQNSDFERKIIKYELQVILIRNLR